MSNIVPGVGSALGRRLIPGPGLALPRWQAALILAICGLFGVAGWLFYTWAFHRDPGQDWMVFYTAARAYLDGHLPLIFDGEALTAAINQRFADWLGITLNLHPWVYPPTFLLLFVPFALLPPLASITVFLAAGFVLAWWAAWPLVERGAARWLVGLSLVLCPAVPFNVMTGQNAFYTTALLTGGVALLARSPLLGGALLGLATYKPQFCFLVPVALLAARQWRALAAAAGSALGLALLSLVVLGVEPWRQWIELMTGGSEAYTAWVTAGRLNGISVFACVAQLGAPMLLAKMAQGGAILAAAAIVYWVFRQRGPAALQIAALLAATILAAPHASASDAVLLALAASLFVTVPACGIRPVVQATIAAALWISPLFNPPSVFLAGSVTPVLILMVLASICATIRPPLSQPG